jgi:hypothetical protein
MIKDTWIVFRERIEGAVASGNSGSAGNTGSEDPSLR